jgi:hypothetical protein
MNAVAVRKNLVTLLEVAQAATREAHADAIQQARASFEERLVQAVAYKLHQALDAITGD